MEKKEEQQNKPVEFEKPKKGSFVTMPEIIDMKALRMLGLSYQKIAERIGRHIKTVIKSLALFEKILPEQADLKNKIIDRIDEISERHLNNAEVIIQAADNQVMRKIYLEETTAKDAAWIREVYGRILNAGLGLERRITPDSGDTSPKVTYFLNTVINIQNNQKDDRLKSTAGVKETVRKNEHGRAEASVEGVVLK